VLKTASSEKRPERSTADVNPQKQSVASDEAHLEPAPEEVRHAPENPGPQRPAPLLDPIADGEVRDQRRDERDGEAGAGPLLEPRE
jgi:hypothetical protein